MSICWPVWSYPPRLTPRVHLLAGVELPSETDPVSICWPVWSYPPRLTPRVHLLTGVELPSEADSPCPSVDRCGATLRG